MAGQTVASWGAVSGSPLGRRSAEALGPRPQSGNNGRNSVGLRPATAAPSSHPLDLHLLSRPLSVRATAGPTPAVLAALNIWAG